MKKEKDNDVSMHRNILCVERALSKSDLDGSWWYFFF